MLLLPLLLHLPFLLATMRRTCHSYKAGSGGGPHGLQKGKAGMKEEGLGRKALGRGRKSAPGPSGVHWFGGARGLSLPPTGL